MTGDIRIDALLNNGGLSSGLLAGSALTVSYRFMDDLAAPEGQTALNETVHDFTPMSEEQRQSVRTLLDKAFAEIGVRFREVGTDEAAMLRFGLSSGINGEGDDASEIGYAMYRGPGGLEPLVMVNHLKATFQADPTGLDFQRVILHEVGHALGLKHPGKYHDDQAGPFLPEDLDHIGNSVMSYNHGEGNWAVNQLGSFDLLALQYLYGTNPDKTVGPVARTLEPSDYYFVGSAHDDVMYFAPGSRQEYARSVATSWGDDQLHVDVEAMEPWEWIIFRGGEGLDALILNKPSSVARNLSPEDDVSQFFLVDGREERHFNLESVERVAFTDLAVALDVDQGAGEAYRIYKAAFDREPDQSGLGYWIHEMDQGASLIEVAASFIGSDEFTERYGADVADTAFIDALYTNVLARQPDSEGYTYWLNELNKGLSREKLLANFSESPENQANVAELIGEGIAYDPWLA